MTGDSIIDDSGNTLFDYSLRVSRKARYAKLQIKPFSGLVVVIPTRFPRKAVPELVKQHAAWIERQLKKHSQQYAKPELPCQIHLPIDGSYRTINYVDSLANRLSVKADDLIISADSFDAKTGLLRHWVRQQAWQILPPLLQAVSDNCGLGFQKVSIRSQKTRWGSCSSRGTISLNDQLLFVPVATAQYLMIHELCHTRFMNHSVKFWQLVESLCADYRFHDAALNRAREAIPAWFQYDLYR